MCCLKKYSNSAAAIVAAVAVVYYWADYDSVIGDWRRRLIDGVVNGGECSSILP